MSCGAKEKRMASEGSRGDAGKDTASKEVAGIPVWAEDGCAVAQALSTDIQSGLTEEEAAARLASDGPNKLAEPDPVPLWKRFLSQLKDPMVLLLIAAAVVSAVIGMVSGEGDWADVGIISFVVILNAVLGVAQESKAEEALAALQEMSAATTRVVRGGQQLTVPSADLVRGDVILLEAGDAVPADARLIEAASLRVEESALTGEAVAVDKGTEPVDGNASLADRSGMIHMGTSVAYGRGTAVVTATGMSTEMGKIAESIATAEEGSTPLQKKLDELSRTLTKAVLVICVAIFVLGLVRHGAGMLSSPEIVLATLMTAVSLAVAAIPEGLSAVVTIVLSLGVTRMSRRRAIVRKLPAVETLGCTQVICSDKTGTLTQNKMSVVRRWSPDEDLMMRAMALCSDATCDADGNASGEATEVALVTDAAAMGHTTGVGGALTEAWERVGEAPFDSNRKMMSVVVRGEEDGRAVIRQYTKGAPDEILRRCSKFLSKGGLPVRRNAQLEQSAMAENHAMAGDALRVMAVAMREWEEIPGDCSPESLEQDMTFVGLVGMMDPIRPEVAAAVEEAHGAGIRVVMITGDHVDTATAIGKSLGLVKSREEAMTGAELDAVSDEDLPDVIRKVSVYARVQPEHKVRIVEAWKGTGAVVAMTGDGVNDAPAIKRADIGIGMGITGTDVTKGVADMVLADDNFATIVGAVEEGRRIYDNIRKSIQFLLSGNLAEVLAVLSATLVGFVILRPSQLLWINLITDSLPALALGLEAAEGDSMRRPPRDSKDGIFAGGLGIDAIVQGVAIAALTLASYLAGHWLEFGTMDMSQVVADPSLGKLGITMAFLTLSMVEMFHGFNMRSRRASVFSLPTQNKWIWGSFAVALLRTFVVIEVGPLATMFGFAKLTIREYLAAMGIAFLIVPLMEAYKAIMRGVDRRRFRG